MAKKKDNEVLFEAVSSAFNTAERKNLLRILGGRDFKYFPHPDDPEGPAVLVVRPRWVPWPREPDPPGVKTATFDTELEFAVRWANQGDWGCLADYIEESRMGNKEMRTFVVGVLRQELKKPPRRAPTARRLWGQVMDRARFFLLLTANGVGREDAIDMTAEKFGADRRTIQRDIKRGKNAAMFFDSLTELALKIEKYRRYAVSDAALTPYFMS